MCCWKFDCWCDALDLHRLGSCCTTLGVPQVPRTGNAPAGITCAHTAGERVSFGEPRQHWKSIQSNSQLGTTPFVLGDCHRPHPEPSTGQGRGAVGMYGTWQDIFLVTQQIMGF
jgi:hypothetical protein